MIMVVENKSRHNLIYIIQECWIQSQILKKVNACVDSDVTH